MGLAQVSGRLGLSTVCIRPMSGPPRCSMRQLGGQHIDQPDVRRRAEQFAGLGHQRGGDGTVEVCLTTLLPGENAAAFKKLYRDVIKEIAPAGPLEEDIAATLTRLLWRKQNLAIFRTAELARDHYRAICEEHFGKRNSTFSLGLTPPAPNAAEAAEAQAREELGDTYELADIGDIVTVDQLLEDLSVEERLDAMIDKCLKRLLVVKGVKSLALTQSASLAPAQKSFAQKCLPRVPSPGMA